MYTSRYAIGGFVALALVLLGACSTDSAVQKILGAGTAAPVFIACKPVSEREIAFQFSLAVEVSSLSFSPSTPIQSVQGGEMVRVFLEEDLLPGTALTVDMVVEDASGNTLNLLIPFRARNNRMPTLRITELRTEYSKPKVEFVEFETLSAGNLGALRLFTAGNGMDEPLYQFPPVEVAAGEYVVLHLRTLDPSSVDETGSDLAASPATKESEAQPDARDFWIGDSKKRLRKTDAVILMDQDNQVLDAVLLSEISDGWWKDVKLEAAVEFLGQQNAWPTTGGSSPGPADAVPTRDTTATRTICRDESIPNHHQAGDWYITVTSGATPGKPNNPNRYVPRQ